MVDCDYSTIQAGRPRAPTDMPTEPVGASDDGGGGDDDGDGAASLPRSRRASLHWQDSSTEEDVVESDRHLFHKVSV